MLFARTATSLIIQLERETSRIAVWYERLITVASVVNMHFWLPGIYIEKIRHEVTLECLM